jgi:hypothetical protein
MKPLIAALSSQNLQKWIAPFPKVVLLKQAFVKDCLYNQALVKVARYAIDRPPADANISDDNGVADTANAINNGGARNTEEGTTDDDDVFVLQSKVAHPADQDNVDDINPTTDPPGTQLTYFVDDEDADDSYVFPVPKKKKIADFEEVPVPRSIALRSDAADNDKEGMQICCVIYRLRELSHTYNGFKSAHMIQSVIERILCISSSTRIPSETRTCATQL